MAGFILLACWAFVSLKHVSQVSLAGSTIPYSVSAREVFGQPGRVIMGIAVVSGTCGLFNGLFLLAGRSLRHMADSICPLSPSRTAYIWSVSSVICSLCIGSFMASGLAGSDRLEIFTYGPCCYGSCWSEYTVLRQHRNCTNNQKQRRGIGICPLWFFPWLFYGWRAAASMPEHLLSSLF